jgi:hypothetical protein
LRLNPRPGWAASVVARALLSTSLLTITINHYHCHCHPSSPSVARMMRIKGLGYSVRRDQPGENQQRHQQASISRFGGAVPFGRLKIACDIYGNLPACLPLPPERPLPRPLAPISDNYNSAVIFRMLYVCMHACRQDLYTYMRIPCLKICSTAAAVKVSPILELPPFPSQKVNPPWRSSIHMHSSPGYSIIQPFPAVQAIPITCIQICPSCFIGRRPYPHLLTQGYTRILLAHLN